MAVLGSLVMARMAPDRGVVKTSSAVTATSAVPAAPIVMTGPVEPTAVPCVALDDRIRAESIVWLTTVSAGGQPHIVPIWFHWDGRTFLICTKPGARKVRNILANPAVMLALGDPTADFDVLLVEGVADVLDPPTSDLVATPFFLAYAERMADIGLSRGEFLATYSLAIRIRPTRYLGWSGRSHLDERRQQVPGAR